MSYTYRYPRPAVTADTLVLCSREGEWYLLLIQRAHAPFQGKWALPGGFMEEDERLEETARRELQEETGIVAGKMEFAGIFDKPGRDPRGRTITAVYVTKTEECQDVKGGDDAARAAWHPLEQLPELAFDHREIIETILGERNDHPS